MLYPYIKQAGLQWMFPIIFLSFIGLAITMERSFYWMKEYSKTKGRNQKLSQIYNLNPFSPHKVLEICRNTKDQLLVTISEFIIHYNSVPLDLAYRKTQVMAEKKVVESRKFLDILSLIASIAGTLGLMGTVVGISQSFKTLANDDPKGLASSLSTAMYTTIGGIILFLMSYLFHFFFEKFSDQLEDDLDKNIEIMKDLLEEKEKSRPLLFDKPQGQEPVIQIKTKSVAKEPMQQNIMNSKHLKEENQIAEKEKKVYEKKA